MAVGLDHGVAHELGGGHVLAEFHAGPAEIAQRLPGLSGPLLLLLHQLTETLLVNGQALVGRHLDGQVDGEAEGVVQAERVGAGEHLLALGLVLRQQIGEDLHAAVDGAGKVLLLGADDLGDIALFLTHIRVFALIDLHDGIHHLIKEGVVHAQELAVPGSPPQQAAHDIAAPLVGGQDAVADHEDGGPDMVGDHAQGDVARFSLCP